MKKLLADGYKLASELEMRILGSPELWNRSAEIILDLLLLAEGVADHYIRCNVCDNGAVAPEGYDCICTRPDKLGNAYNVLMAKYPPKGSVANKLY